MKVLQRPETTGNMEQLEAATMQFFDAVMRKAASQPQPDRNLDDEVDRRLEALDWAGALSTLEALRAVARERREDALIFSRCRRISELLRVTGRLAESRSVAREATDAARRLAQMDAAVAAALENESTCARWSGEHVEALRLADEGLRLWGDPAGLGRLSRARMLVGRARCRLALDDLAGAEEDLQEAWPAVSDFADGTVFMGAQGALIQWKSTRARLLRVRGELAAAGELQAEVVERIRAVAGASESPLHHFGPGLARALRDLSEWLADAGDDDGARTADSEFRELLQKLRLDALPRPL